MSETVPTLLYVVPLSGALFFASVVVLARRRQLTAARTALAALTATYIGGIVANTVFPISLAPQHHYDTEPLPLNLVPFAQYELRDAAINVAVFVPLGIIVPLMLTRPGPVRVILILTATSAMIEVTQFVTACLAHGGHIADVNDLATNTLGGAIGFGLYTISRRQPRIARVLRRLQWHADPPSGNRRQSSFGR